MIYYWYLQRALIGITDQIFLALSNRFTIKHNSSSISNYKSSVKLILNVRDLN